MKRFRYAIVWRPLLLAIRNEAVGIDDGGAALAFADIGPERELLAEVEREEQAKELLRSFERVVAHGPMEIVLVFRPHAVR